MAKAVGQRLDMLRSGIKAPHLEPNILRTALTANKRPRLMRSAPNVTGKNYQGAIGML